MRSPPVPDTIKTLSVVLPCANESEFVAKTVAAVFEATPPDELREVIVIDDASRPAISEEVSADFLQAHKARILRYADPQGLIRSKIHGAEAAEGDVIVFLDCHVKPMEAWTEPILANLRENPRRVVVPLITSLDPDTWQEVSPDGGGKKMCLTWNADFIWCNEYPGPYVPIMSGGLLALSKFWWDTTGGYDEHMLAWGGENLDQSLRTWLCGGEIVVAETSRVAHMWREPSKPKTQLRYSIPSDCVRRNRLRAVQAWLGPWADKVRGFPEFQDFGEGGTLSIGSLANVDRYRERLQCKGFEAYLHRFRDLYIGYGRLPSSVFHIQEASTGLCLQLEVSFKDGDTGRITLAPCNRDAELQRFHESNAKVETTECCSGLKVWDFSQCIATYEIGGYLSADACEMGGDTPGQRLRFTDDAQILWEPGEGVAEDGCLAPKAERHSAVAPGAFLSLGTECPSKVRFVDEAGEVKRFRVVSGDKCLSAVFGQENGAQLVFLPCAEGGEDMLFTFTHTFEDGRQQVVTSHGLCVDAKHGSGPLIVWPCDPVGLNNPNQLYIAEEGAALVWRTAGGGDSEDSSYCVDAMEKVVLSQCLNQPGGDLAIGQTFQKRSIAEDDTFELRQGDTGYCLGFMALEEGYPDNQFLVSAPCSGKHHQRWADEGGRLRNPALDLCVDANDMTSPILFSCYDLGDLPQMQNFVVNESGSVFMPRGWSDNGRKRFPTRCLDSRPAPPYDVAAQKCEEVRNQGTRWTKLWPEVPLETRLFHESEAKLRAAELGMNSA